MKRIFPLVLMIAIIASCTRRSNPVGYGTTVSCMCHTNGTSNSYLLGNPYNPLDSLFYTDTCAFLKKSGSWDTCIIGVITN
jgi:hypothetical protein